MTRTDLVIIGGGLAGSEAAWQAAQRGLRVDLYEMRPLVETGAHTGGNLAELVCSNSLGSNLPDRANGVLKNELRRLGSLLVKCADATALPAGGALAVDREKFSRLVTEILQSHPGIRVIRKEMREIPNLPTIIASGPLTSSALSRSISTLTGEAHLYFYDAIAPIVTRESINFNAAYPASRYSRGEIKSGDYVNCPLNEQEYNEFIANLLGAERIDLMEFEKVLENGVTAGADQFFEGCLPVEILAARHPHALAFGPMRPVGLTESTNG